MQSESQNVNQGVTGHLLQAKPVHQKVLSSGSSTSSNVWTRRACSFRRFLFKYVHGLWQGTRLNLTVLHWFIRTWSLVRCRRQGGLPTPLFSQHQTLCLKHSKGPWVVTLCPCKRALLWLSLQVPEFISGYNQWYIHKYREYLCGAFLNPALVDLLRAYSKGLLGAETWAYVWVFFCLFFLEGKSIRCHWSTLSLSPLQSRHMPAEINNGTFILYPFYTPFGIKPDLNTTRLQWDALACGWKEDQKLDPP